MDISNKVVFIWALPVLTVLSILAIIFRIVSVKKHCPSSEDATSNIQLTDPPCSSSSSSAPTWDVFLSFHGKDTRRNFTSHLYHALCQAGIQTFIDDHALEKGQEISSTLLDTIRNSNMFIVVLSENYASSRWCLDELAEILSCKRIDKQVVPVFYYVDPSDVRHQEGSFGKAFDCHKKRYSVDRIGKWKSALSEIAKLSGYHLRKEANETESETLQEIVGNLAPQASTKVVHLEKYLFGVESAVEEIYQKLSLESNDVRAIGICGMGGIGKTTIAKAFYNRYFNKFDISCFSVSAKQYYSAGGSTLLQLLQQLLIDLLNKNDYKISDVESGIRKLKHILHSKKALIVLDNLDCANYSEFLVNIGNLFSAGSKIIITTRDANLLDRLKADISAVDIYMVKTLGRSESLKLFCYHAFRNTVQPESLKELSLCFVTHAGGLPLALKVLGSSLLGRTHESFWKDKLEKVKAIPEDNIQKILRLSYDELEDEMQKAIFLDIAFFFVGKDKDEAVDVFKSCGFFPGVGITNLVDRCLLTVDKDNKFEMHNLIQDMGRELGKTTGTRLFLRGNEYKRLFLRGNVCKDSQYLEEGHNIEGVVLDLTTSIDGQLTTCLFERMSNLRLLQINSTHDIRGNFTNLFPQLRCIRWHSSPWTHMPSTFLPETLISIDMASSKLNMLWKDPRPIKQLNHLGCLHLSGCLDLKRLPEQLGEMKGLKMIDASHTAIERLPDSITHLKKLIQLKLRSCEKLTNLPEQLGGIKGLKELDARYSAITQLPDSITQLKELYRLDLYGCMNLKNIPEQIGNIHSLRTFNAGKTAIEHLPDSITQLKELANLYLVKCKKLTKLPEQLGEMKGLKELNACSSAITQLPDTITQLKELFRLDLFGCKNLRNIPEQIGNVQSIRIFRAGDTAIEQLPDSFVGLVNLERLNLNRCKNLRNLPDSIWKLKLLQELLLCYCSKLERVPEQLGGMQCLEHLYAHHTAIEKVPDSIRLLSRLKKLRLGSCKKLKYVPESIWNLTSVERLDLEAGDIGIISLPDSVENLNKLTYLELSCNVRLCLPMILRFPSLETLTLTDEGQILSSAEPVSLSQLLNLRALTLNKCTSLGSSLPELPLNLRTLILCDHSSLEQLPDLSSLKMFKRLFIRRCSSLQSISILPPQLRSVSVEECASLQDLPDLSMLKELEYLRFTGCNNLKSISLRPSVLQVGQADLQFSAHLQNREVADWFTYKSSGRTVSFNISPSSGSNFSGLLLWVVYTFKATDYKLSAYVRAAITNSTEGITENYPIYVCNGARSTVKCITGKNISMKSGDRIKVSIPSLAYFDYELKVPAGGVKVKMFGVHVIQD